MGKQDKFPNTIDDLFDVITKWHIPIFTFAFIRGLPSTAYLMSLVFTAPRQNFTCVAPAGWIAMQDECHMKPWRLNNDTLTADILPCTQWTYDHSIYAGVTIVEEWDLVCSQKWMVSTMQSVYLFGIMCGNIIFAHVTDWFGRKRSSLIALIWCGITGTLMAFAPSVIWYIVLRFLTAVGTTAYYEASLLLVMESLAPTKRYMVTLTIGLGWSCGMVLVPVISYVLSDWKLVNLAPSLMIAALLADWIFLDESARWLLGAGRFEEAREILLRVAKGRGDVDEHRVNEIVQVAKEKSEQNGLKTKPTLADLFSQEFRKQTLILCFVMMVSGLLWYHSSVSTAAVSSHPYLNFAIAAIFELPAKILNVLFIRFIPRRNGTIMALGVAAVSIAVYCFLPNEDATLRLSSLILCKIFVGVQGSIQRVQICESYPSILRSLSNGLIVTMCNFALVFAPYFDEIGYVTFSWVPMASISVLCVACCVAQLYLRETFETTLTDGISASKRVVDSKLAKVNTICRSGTV